MLRAEANGGGVLVVNTCVMGKAGRVRCEGENERRNLSFIGFFPF